MGFRLRAGRLCVWHVDVSSIDRRSLPVSWLVPSFVFSRPLSVTFRIVRLSRHIDRSGSVCSVSATVARRPDPTDRSASGLRAKVAKQ